MDWLKFSIAFALLVIVPVWIFRLVELSIFYKLAFTLAGAGGVYIALEYGSMKGVSNRGR